MIIRTGGLRVAALILPLALVACGRGDDSDRNLQQLDKELVEGNSTDPALTAALHDQIMVDPNLSAQSNGDALRPPTQPYSAATAPDDVATNNARLPQGTLLKAPAPTMSAAGCRECTAKRESLTLGALAARQSAKGTGQCASAIRYSARWANRLPPDVPLYPKARVIEAAGTDTANCQLRVVSFSSPAPLEAMLDWYYTAVTRAGYDAEHQVEGAQHVLGGTRKRDGGAYVIFLSPRKGGGTDLDLIANNGV